MPARLRSRQRPTEGGTHSLYSCPGSRAACGAHLAGEANREGALEYQGKMFVEMGGMAKAKANLATLVKLCPSGCEERENLEKAIASAPKTE